MTDHRIDVNALGREWQDALAAYERLDAKPPLADFLEHWHEDQDYAAERAERADLLVWMR